MAHGGLRTTAVGCAVHLLRPLSSSELWFSYSYVSCLYLSAPLRWGLCRRGSLAVVFSDVLVVVGLGGHRGPCLGISPSWDWDYAELEIEPNPLTYKYLPDLTPFSSRSDFNATEVWRSVYKVPTHSELTILARLPKETNRTLFLSLLQPLTSRMPCLGHLGKSGSLNFQNAAHCWIPQEGEAPSSSHCPNLRCPLWTWPCITNTYKIDTGRGQCKHLDLQSLWALREASVCIIGSGFGAAFCTILGVCFGCLMSRPPNGACWSWKARFILDGCILVASPSCPVLRSSDMKGEMSMEERWSLYSAPVHARPAASTGLSLLMWHQPREKSQPPNLQMFETQRG